MRLNKNHKLPGTLIVVEGIDGSGKSTQLNILKEWLCSVTSDVIFTEWNSSALISETTKSAKKKNMLTPRTFSILHAVDFADRLEQVIVPALKAGFIVLADRYAFTAFARDVARGVDPKWVRNMYGFSIKPDISMYFRVPVEESLNRICYNRQPKFYEAGMDLNLSNNPYESYKIFQTRVVHEYDKMVDEFGLIKVDAMDSIHSKQEFFRQVVKDKLKEKGMKI